MARPSFQVLVPDKKRKILGLLGTAHVDKEASARVQLASALSRVKELAPLS